MLRHTLFVIAAVLLAGCGVQPLPQTPAANQAAVAVSAASESAKLLEEAWQLYRTRAGRSGLSPAFEGKLRAAAKAATTVEEAVAVVNKSYLMPTFSSVMGFSVAGFAGCEAGLMRAIVLMKTEAEAREIGALICEFDSRRRDDYNLNAGVSTARPEEFAKHVEELFAPALATAIMADTGVAKLLERQRRK